MSELKPAPGYSTIEQEFEDRLKRAFVEGKADFIYVDSRRDRFLIECMHFGIGKSWIKAEMNYIEEQYSRWEGRLTNYGKQYFGLPYTKQFTLYFE